MTAKVIACTVPAWSRAAGEPLRSRFERDMARFLGTSAVESARPLLETTPIDRLASVWHRLPYVEKVEHLFDPQWTLGLTPLSRNELIRHAFGMPLACGVLLEIRARRPTRDRLRLFTEVPWFALLKESDRLQKDLLTGGWLVFGCHDWSKARHLQSRVKGTSIRCTVLGSPAAS